MTTPETPTELQLRLLLEQRCSETARAILADFVFQGAHLFLAMFAYGKGGGIAWFSDADMPTTRAAVARWAEAGMCEPIPVASQEHAQRWADAMRSLADRVRQACVAGTGFALILFTPERALSYVSSGDRDDVRTTLREWLQVDGGGTEVAEA